MKIKEKLREMSIESCSMFYMNMAALLIGLADSMLELPAMQAAGDEDMVRAKENPTIIDYTKVLSGIDLGRSLSLNLQLQKFLKWYGDQDTDKFFGWESFDTLAGKWNEFVFDQKGSESDA